MGCCCHCGLVNAIGISHRTARPTVPEESNFLMSIESKCWQLHAAGVMTVAEVVMKADSPIFFPVYTNQRQSLCLWQVTKAIS